MIHFYPGMGATGAMYSGPWRRLSNAAFHDWPPYQGETTIPQIAKRLIGEHAIRPGHSVAGSSLGGIVACEIANQLETDRLILIGSARSKQEISAILALLHPLAKLAPLEFLRQAAGKFPQELSAMFAQSDPAFVRAMCQAIFKWEGLKSDVTKIRIHGKNDRVIPLPSDVRHPIDGGHLIAMTHPEECIEQMGQSGARI